jgi:hypothetical protein
MTHHRHDPKKLPGANEPTKASKDKQQEELARQLPGETPPTEQRGEPATGEVTAKGGKRNPAQTRKDKQQEELVRKLPSETQPAEERGERLATGKQIAGGKMDKEKRSK